MSNPSVANLQALRERLCSPELDQSHLFKDWPEYEYTPKQTAMLEELYTFAQHYPGGVEQYIRNGKELLDADSEEETSLLALEMPPRVIKAPSLYFRSKELEQLEASGAELIKKTIFVLVAGGLGERLGYGGIKVGLPLETATQRCYLTHYLSWVRAAAGRDAPFIIMTSDDTHLKTQDLLDELRPDMPNLRLLKQETVFCFADGAAHLALDENGALLRKPHGHGDVHSLIYAAKATAGSDTLLVDHWKQQGYKHIVFFQDTNATATLTLPISLAVSEKERLDMNFTCVPRKPKEAIGLLCRTQRSGGSEAAEREWRTSVVEYNVFEAVAGKLTKEGGDVAVKKTEYSAFPGSINTLLLNFTTYVELLEASKGAVPEFINPKYADDTRRKFKKPARVESLMQDIALLLSEKTQRVGGTVFERFTYQPVKNSLEDGCDKVKKHMHPYCPTSGEADFYELTRRRLKAVGVPLVYSSDGDVSVSEGVMSPHLFPIITLDATASTGGSGVGIGGLSDLQKVFPQPSDVNISADSSLLIEGKVIIESLDLDGSLKIVGPPAESDDAPLTIRGLRVHNAKWQARPTNQNDTKEEDLIRGFVLDKSASQVVDSKSKL